MLIPAGFIDGATVHGSTLRRALYASTGGKTGVVRANDLAVVDYTTPGNGVWINPGSGIVATRFTDAYAGESYMVSVGSGMVLPVPANNTSTTSTWQVIIRVKDPQFAGEAPITDPDDPHSVVELVRSLPSTKPHLWLATVVLPANTATVLQSMITDRRQLAMPRSERILKSIPVTKVDHLESSSFEQYPDELIFQARIPEWATEMRVKVDWFNLASMPGAGIFELTAQLGFGRPDARILNSTHMVIGYSAGGSGEQRRQNTGVADTIKVPSGWKGQTITIMGWARKKQGNIELIADAWAAATFDIQFVEAPERERTG